MNSKLGTLVGLFVLLAGGTGIYVLFRQGPPVGEEVEALPRRSCRWRWGRFAG